MGSGSGSGTSATSSTLASSVLEDLLVGAASPPPPRSATPPLWSVGEERAVKNPLYIQFSAVDWYYIQELLQLEVFYGSGTAKLQLLAEI